jgi:hypothetical protein
VGFYRSYLFKITVVLSQEVNGFFSAFKLMIIWFAFFQEKIIFFVIILARIMVFFDNDVKFIIIHNSFIKFSPIVFAINFKSKQSNIFPLSSRVRIAFNGLIQVGD